MNKKITSSIIICYAILVIRGHNSITLSPLKSRYCPPPCDCGKGSNLPITVQPLSLPVHHVYCTITDAAFNFTDEMNIAIDTKQSLDVHIKCYGNTKILWTTSEFLQDTFAIRMYGCNIVNEGPILFPELTSLQLLIIDTIKQTDVDKFEFQGLAKLIILQISNSNLTKVPDLPFMSNLVVLNLGGNTINILGCDIFYQKICQICLVNLSENLITSVPDCKGNMVVHSSTSFIFANNKIIDIGHIGHLQMINVDLSYNLIQHLPIFSYTDLFNLTVSHNIIRDIKSTSFPEILFLRYLDLSFNHIQTIEASSFSNLYNLKELLLTGNKLIEFDWRYVPVTYEEVYINLNRNLLRYPPFVINAPPHNYRLLKIVSAENPFVCDCHIRGFEKRIKSSTSVIYLDVDRMKCHQPTRLRNEFISKINFTTSCPLLIRCPLSCECEYHTADNITVIQCSDRSISSLPIDMPEGRLSLNFSRNQIDILDPRGYFSRTQQLDLSSNRIINITSTGLSLLSNVKHLFLHRNIISELPRTVIDVPFANNTIIHLSQNAWHCTCDLLWFPEWLRGEQSLVSDKNQLQCHLLSPARQVVDITSDILNCKPPLDINIKYAIALALLIIFFIVITIIIFKFRFEAKVLLYSRFHLTFFGPTPFGDSYLKNKEYDVLVAYCDDDFQWTRDTILHRLENVETPPYKTLVPDRDFVPGIPLDENIANAINSSYCTLIVFSKKFQESEWCLYYFHRAYEHMLREKDMRIVIIMKDKCDVSILNNDLQAYFKSHTYLVIHDKLFWDKLLYILPKQQSFVGIDKTRI